MGCHIAALGLFFSLQKEHFEVTFRGLDLGPIVDLLILTQHANVFMFTYH